MSETAELIGDFVDLAFTLEGDALPRQHRRALAAAIEQVLPWLVDIPGAAVHRLNVSAGGGPLALLSRRTRLTLRLPRQDASRAARLGGALLDVGGHALRVGHGQPRELYPWGTMYAHLVAADDPAWDEAQFLQHLRADLDRLGIKGRAICGREQLLDDGYLRGFSVMVDGLPARDALRIMEHGLGPHRRLGCGIFVPHKSSAAVGAPPD
jgi:CRISPR-associated protein Cas6